MFIKTMRECQAALSKSMIQDNIRILTRLAQYIYQRVILGMEKNHMIFKMIHKSV